MKLNLLLKITAKIKTTLKHKDGLKQRPVESYDDK